jgi:hypothetical protein
MEGAPGRARATIDVQIRGPADRRPGGHVDLPQADAQVHPSPPRTFDVRAMRDHPNARRHLDELVRLCEEGRTRAFRVVATG